MLWFSDMFFTLTGLDPKYELGPEIWLSVFHAQDLPRVLKASLHALLKISFPLLFPSSIFRFFLLTRWLLQVYTAAMESGEDFWFDCEPSEWSQFAFRMLC